MTSDPLPNRGDDPLDLLRIGVVIEGTEILWANSSPVPPRLWHYTDSGGALGMLAQRELWATHALFMNDASELRLAYPMLRDALEVARQQMPGNDLLTLITEELGTVVSSLPDDPEIYAVCFCEEGDLLGQWRAYGVAGGGYAVGFDGPSIQSDSISTYGLSLTRVIYDPDQQRQLAQKLVDGSIGAWVHHVNRQPQNDAEESLKVVAESFSHLAQSFGYQIKDAAFSEEREWRLIYAREPDGVVDAARRRFRSGARGLVPYVPIPMGAEQGTWRGSFRPRACEPFSPGGASWTYCASGTGFAGDALPHPRVQPRCDRGVIVGHPAPGVAPERRSTDSPLLQPDATPDKFCASHRWS
ncbi:DUF2971 domain-containing protein [Solirubrobacter pauli]|uniref:DUF2971 domain-containing protein n=1 Tax=Solirubrobacter pauli TaxID=166793 RepID=UPI0011C4475E|nr:DUF2971 domain-containing protein [Solirubrobacter pauli]